MGAVGPPLRAHPRGGSPPPHGLVLLHARAQRPEGGACVILNHLLWAPRPPVCTVAVRVLLRFLVEHRQQLTTSHASFMFQPTKKCQVTLLHRLEGTKARAINKILWSPNGACETCSHVNIHITIPWVCRDRFASRMHHRTRGSDPSSRHRPPNPKHTATGSFLVMANLSEGSTLEFYDADANATLAKRCVHAHTHFNMCLLGVGSCMYVCVCVYMPPCVCTTGGRARLSASPITHQQPWTVPAHHATPTTTNDFTNKPAK